MPELLLVEDNPRLVLTLRDRLRNAGHRVTLAQDGEAGLETATRQRFDCILLDVGLPKMSGFDVCRELRRRNVQTPILMLTARGDVLDRVQGLKLGADDYLPKPFEMLELLARIEALLRRTPPVVAEPDSYDFGALHVDFRSGNVTRDGVSVDLSDLELKVLRYLVEHRGSIVTREELLAAVWKHDEPPLTRTVDVRIASLRQKIGASLIVTVHGEGYKFVGRQVL
ncbi:MAG TPA: response regulator transcription factor [Thermoanaerobaculia bacterium]|nr:response regulator transcription factor [Thermoanaerobaculia bacterium]